jgi:hypothetical protein
MFWDIFLSCISFLLVAAPTIFAWYGKTTDNRRSNFFTKTKKLGWWIIAFFLVGAICTGASTLISTRAQNKRDSTIAGLNDKVTSINKVLNRNGLYYNPTNKDLSVIDTSTLKNLLTRIITANNATEKIKSSVFSVSDVELAHFEINNTRDTFRFYIPYKNYGPNSVIINSRLILVTKKNGVFKNTNIPSQTQKNLVAPPNVPIKIEGYYNAKPGSYDSLFIYYQIQYEDMQTHKVRMINEARVFDYNISYTNLVTDKKLLHILDSVYNKKE